MGQGVSNGIKFYDNNSYKMEVSPEHSISLLGTPNSVVQTLDENGNLEKERYYGNDGKALVDIDYTDHGNPVGHPKVPHKHKWDWSTNPPKRGKAE